MGCFPGKWSIEKGNPDPYLFEINKCKVIGSFTIALISYPDCKNYEGKKVLVFEGVSEQLLYRLDEIDPHFHEEGLSPIARFAPTQRGWNYAVILCSQLELARGLHIDAECVEQNDK